MPAKHKYYVVWRGRQTGIFSNWEDCSKQVTGFTGAEFMAFENREAAERARRGAYADYKGQHISILSPQRLAAIGAPIQNSYAVDAACSGNPGDLEFRCVHTESRREVSRHGPHAQGTNNVGEFLALVHALALFDRQHISLPIYSDSENGIAWVQAQRCKTRLVRTRQNAELFEQIAWAEGWLAGRRYANKILKWETEAWGEIPADFGRK
jgi:ribonuclease HI